MNQIPAQTPILTFPPIPKPSKTSFKYLARTFHLNHAADNDDSRKLKIIKVKRFHIRKFTEENPRFHRSSVAKQFSVNTKPILKKKLFKVLTYLKMISSFFDPHFLQELKHSKNLAQFWCHPNFKCSPQNPIRYLQKINKNLEKINIYIDPSWLMPQKTLSKLYRAVGRLYKLKTYEGERSLHGLQSSDTELEFMDLNKCLEKLPRLENFECNITELGLCGLEYIMSHEEVYEKVTNLNIDLEIFKPEEPDDSEEEDEEETLSFFQFQAFPNLKELYIKDQSGDCSYGPHVVEGFKSLVFLQKLSLQITSCPGVNFFFEGFYQLPQLSSFHLDFTDMLTPQNWKSLVQATQQQASLSCFDIKIQLNEVEDKQHLEDLLASLSHKPKLKYLIFKADSLPFNVLSNGFKRLVESDQLKSIQLEAGKRIFSSRNPILPSFEGFYDFLLRNKNTLTELKLDFPLFQQTELNDAFGSVLSQLAQLKVFSLDISVSSLFYQTSYPFKTCLNKVEYEQGDQELWNLRLNDLLPQLGKVERLTLVFDGLQDCPADRRKFMNNCFRVLPSLKNLRHLDFSLPETGLSSKEFASINGVLGEFKYLLSMELLNVDIQDKNLKILESQVAHYNKANPFISF